MEGMRKGLGAIGWVAIVVVIGAVVGLALVAASPPAPPSHGPGAPPSGPVPVSRLNYVLSTIDVALVLALLFVYLRTFTQTRARFALGLSIFLAALTIQTVFVSPLLFGALGYNPGVLGPYLLVSSVFEIVALAVFLFLSLE